MLLQSFLLPLASVFGLEEFAKFGCFVSHFLCCSIFPLTINTACRMVVSIELIIPVVFCQKEEQVNRCTVDWSCKKKR